LAVEELFFKVEKTNTTLQLFFEKQAIY